MHGWYGGMDGWGYVLMSVSFILFWALLIVAIAMMVRYLFLGERQRTAVPPPRPPAEQVLAERFARGDIDEEEYRRDLDVLRAEAGPAPGP